MSSPVFAINPSQQLSENDPIEVIDHNNRTLLVMPLQSVRQQSLPHRSILVALRDTKNRIYIHRCAERQQPYPNLWNISAFGYAHVGEAQKDAAQRILNNTLGIPSIRLFYKGGKAVSPSTGFSRINLYSSTPSNSLPIPNKHLASTGMFVDKDELDALLQGFPELLTPALYWAIMENILFL